MGTYFDINGTAMIYISVSHAKTKKEADNIINKTCQTIKETFKENLQNLAKQQPDIFDPISFDGFYLPGIDIHVFQNHAHGPSTTINHKNVHDTATLTINGTFETDDYDEHLQLIINTFNQTFNADNRYYGTDYSLFRLNLISMWEGQQDATIFDNDRNIVTIPLLKG
mgnify:CR=1 FL=1|jgi:hypothetical protein